MKAKNLLFILMGVVIFSPEIINAQQYCIPPGFKPIGGVGEPFTYISKVKLEDLEQNSGIPTGVGQDNGYTYFENANVPGLSKGESYLLEVVSNDDLGQGMEVRVWIDWNGDKEFHATNELAAQWGGAGDHKQSITVPTNAKTGITRMRVYCDMPTSMGHIPPEPCGYLNYPGHSIGQHGEVEDYDIQVGSTVGIGKAIANSEVKIFPNPASTKITVQHNFTKATQYRIRDTFGRTVMRGKLDQASVSLDVSDLSAGQYVLTVEGESSFSNYSISISR